MESGREGWMEGGKKGRRRRQMAGSEQGIERGGKEGGRNGRKVRERENTFPSLTITLEPVRQLPATGSMR